MSVTHLKIEYVPEADRDSRFFCEECTEDHGYAAFICEVGDCEVLATGHRVLDCLLACQSASHELRQVVPVHVDEVCRELLKMEVQESAARQARNTAVLLEALEAGKDIMVGGDYVDGER